jgi:hypothetical protein
MKKILQFPSKKLPMSPEELRKQNIRNAHFVEYDNVEYVDFTPDNKFFLVELDMASIEFFAMIERLDHIQEQINEKADRSEMYNIFGKFCDLFENIKKILKLK